MIRTEIFFWFAGVASMGIGASERESGMCHGVGIYWKFGTEHLKRGSMDGKCFTPYKNVTNFTKNNKVSYA
jgi:hypothetical protein